MNGEFGTNTDIDINKNIPNRVFVSFGGNEPDDVWYTEDGGETWEVRTGTAPNNLPEVHVNSITFHPQNNDWVYAATDIGVFASEDLGITWSVAHPYPNGEGPINVEVSDLFWMGSQYLIAATYGRGMFRCRPRVVIYVNAFAAPGGDGTEERPFRTITEAVNAAGHGTTITIMSSEYHESPIELDKRGDIKATNGPVDID